MGALRKIAVLMLLAVVVEIIGIACVNTHEEELMQTRNLYEETARTNNLLTEAIANVR